MQVTRRGILIGALAGGGLAIGYMLRPRQFPMPLEAGRDEVAFDAWIKIAGDGVVTVSVPQLEMGQGVTTLIPQIVAQELGADWRQVAVEPGPVSAHYANLPLAARWAELWMPVLPGLAAGPDSVITRRWAENNCFMATADGQSLAAYEGPARAAAASTRALLAMAAAERWGIGWEECSARDGFIWNGNRRLAFAELAEAAARFDPPDPPPLLPDPAWEKTASLPAGAVLPFPRLDLPAKVDGSYLFAGDVRLPDMVYAAIRHGPIGDSSLLDFKGEATKRPPGVIAVVQRERWLAAVADNWWAAEQALTAMAPRFTAKAKADSSEIEKTLDEALRYGDAAWSHERGDPEKELSGHISLARRYDVAPALHATVETASPPPRGGRSGRHPGAECRAISHARRRQFRPAAGA